MAQGERTDLREREESRLQGHELQHPEGPAPQVTCVFAHHWSFQPSRVLYQGAFSGPFPSSQSCQDWPGSLPSRAYPELQHFCVCLTDPQKACLKQI